ncbi:hypothetical protein ACFU44_00015 [Nocardia rhizosphaerihabitans]|uniref:hypothetical protein n=1 Tax=Nocardia rhizosphaerihabitans TaxID=1691570 RepID=UPI00366F87E3
MTTHHRRFGRAGFGITAFGAVAASIVLAAPQASAWVGNLNVAGSDHKVGCSYKLTASVEVDRLTSVKFTDNGVDIPGSPVSPSLLSGTVSITWKPTTAGQHKLEARQLLISDSITVTVGEAAATGSAGCGGGLADLFPSLSAG